MSDGPIEEKHYAMMNALADVLDDAFTGHGFMLMVFDLETHSGRMNYISNANRDDMIAALKEFIAHSEGRIVEPPADALPH